MHKVYTVKSYTSAKGQPRFISMLSSCQQEQENMNGGSAESVQALRTNRLFQRSNVVCKRKTLEHSSQEASKKKSLYLVTSTVLSSFIGSFIESLLSPY